MDYKINPNLLRRLMENFNPGELDSMSSSQMTNPFERNNPEAYFEQHWPEYRDEAIERLHRNLPQNFVLKELVINNQRNLVVTNGNRQNVEDICMRDNEIFGIVGSEIIGKVPHSYRILAYDNEELNPIGFYILIKYFENDKLNLHENHDGERMIGQRKFIYLSPNQRGSNLGSILWAESALELIGDKDIKVIKAEVANKDRVGKLYQKLGFESCDRTTRGYDIYEIDLKERESVGQIFQQYLRKFVQSPSPNK